MRKKIFYVPGLISSVGLTVVLLYYIYKTPHYQREYVLKMIVLPDDPDPPGHPMFSKNGFYHIIKGKSVHEVNFDYEYYLPACDYIFDRKKAFIVGEIERMVFTHDTSAVLKVHLNFTNSYGEFVWLLNQAVTYNVRHYTWFDDDFYFW